MHRSKDLYVDWLDLDTNEKGTYMFRKLLWSDRVLPKDKASIGYRDEERNITISTEVRSYNSLKMSKCTSYDLMEVESAWRGSVLDVDLPNFTYEGLVREVEIGGHKFRLLVVCTYFENKPYIYTFYDIDHELYLGRVADFLINGTTAKAVSESSNKEMSILYSHFPDTEPDFDLYSTSYDSVTKFTDFSVESLMYSPNSNEKTFYILSLHESYINFRGNISGRKRLLPLIGNIDKSNPTSLWYDNWFSCFNTISDVQGDTPPLWKTSCHFDYGIEEMNLCDSFLWYRNRSEAYITEEQGRGQDEVLLDWGSPRAKYIESGNLICLSNKLLLEVPLSFLNCTMKIGNDTVDYYADGYVPEETFIEEPDIPFIEVEEQTLDTKGIQEYTSDKEVPDCLVTRLSNDILKLGAMAEAIAELDDSSNEEDDIDELVEETSEGIDEDLESDMEEASNQDEESEEELYELEEPEDNLEVLDGSQSVLDSSEEGTSLDEFPEEIPEWCQGIVVFLDERYSDIFTFCYIFNVEFSELERIMFEDEDMTLHDALYELIFAVDTSKRRKSFKFRGTHYRDVRSCCCNENVDVSYTSVLSYLGTHNCTKEEAVEAVFQEKRNQRLSKLSKGTIPNSISASLKSSSTPSTSKSKKASSSDKITFNGTEYESVSELCDDLGLDEYIFSLFLEKSKRYKPSTVVKLFYSDNNCSYYEFDGVHYSDLLDCCNSLGISATLVVRAYLQNKTEFRKTIRDLVESKGKKSAYSVEAVE